MVKKLALVAAELLVVVWLVAGAVAAVDPVAATQPELPAGPSAASTATVPGLVAEGGTAATRVAAGLVAAVAAALSEFVAATAVAATGAAGLAELLVGTDWWAAEIVVATVTGKCAAVDGIVSLADVAELVAAVVGRELSVLMTWNSEVDWKQILW